MENWKSETNSAKKVAQEIAKKLRTRNTVGTVKSVFESLHARERPFSALFENSQNWAVSLAIDVTKGALARTTWKLVRVERSLGRGNDALATL